jgi:hypothetical protein
MSSLEWVKFRGSLTRGAKRSLSRATRFIFLELALLARDRSGEILLSPGMSDADAVHDLIGGSRREVVEALRTLTVTLPGDADPLVAFVVEDGARYLTIPSWNRENAPPRERPGASTERSRRHRGNGNATAVARPSPQPLPAVATVTQRSGDERSSGDQIRSDQNSPSESAREAPTSHEPTVEAPKRAKPRPPTSAPPAPADVPAWLTALGVPALDDARWGREVTRWLDHHRAKGSRFVDWAAAWRTWRSRAEEYSRGPLGTPGTQNATTGRFRRTTTVQNAGAALLPSPWDIGLEPDGGTEAP